MSKKPKKDSKKTIKSNKPIIQSTETVVPESAVGTDGLTVVEDKTRNYYFNNPLVERLLTEYVNGACTNVKLRDEIMSHADELIIQIIRTHGLYNIYPGHDPASMGDLKNIAWCQLEKTLYKFDTKPGHTKVFNMWCIAPNSLVITDNGIDTIGDVVDDVLSNKNRTILGVDGFNDIQAALRKPTQNTLIIKANNGYSIECTPEHRLYSIRNGVLKWIHAHDLVYDDLIGIQYYNGEIIGNKNGVVNSIIQKHNNTDFVNIVSIENSKSEVCEISVDSPSHSYIANGFITHNSQVAKTVILAHIKREGRDRKNSNSYKNHLIDDAVKGPGVQFDRFMVEAKEIYKYNTEYLGIIESLEHLLQTDDRPYEGLVGKLVDLTGLSRARIHQFLFSIRMCGDQFSDSPVNGSHEHNRRRYYTDATQEHPEELA